MRNSGIAARVVVRAGTIEAAMNPSEHFVGFVNDAEVKRWCLAQAGEAFFATRVLTPRKKNPWFSHVDVFARRLAGIDLEESVELILPLAEKWIKQYQNGKYSTYISYSRLIKNHLAPAFGSKKCRDIRSTDIQEFINEKLSTLQVGTVQNLVVLLGQILEVQVVDEQLPRNPTITKYRYVSNKKPAEGRALSIDQFRLLQNNFIVRAIPLEDLQLCNETAIETGLRASEFMAMKW